VACLNVTGLVGHTKDPDTEKARLRQILEHAADPGPFDPETAQAAIAGVAPDADAAVDGGGGPAAGGGGGAKKPGFLVQHHDGSTGKWVIIVSLDRDFTRASQLYTLNDLAKGQQYLLKVRNQTLTRGSCSWRPFFGHVTLLADHVTAILFYDCMFPSLCFFCCCCCQGAGLEQRGMVGMVVHNAAGRRAAQRG